jgi:hypothetical protein
MTGEILEADVEVARRLLEADRSDGEIVRALGLRGIEPANAAKLLTDLHAGRKIRSKMILLPRKAPKQRRAD